MSTVTLSPPTQVQNSSSLDVRKNFPQMREQASQTSSTILADEKRMQDSWALNLAVLTFKDPFNGRLMHYLKLKTDHAIPTAATDLRESVFVNPKFYNELKPDEQRGLMYHEFQHCIRRHGLRQGSRDHQIFNLATDHEINDSLFAGGYKLPEGGIFYPQWKDKPAEFVYDELAKNLQKQRSAGSGQGTTGDSRSTDPKVGPSPSDAEVRQLADGKPGTDEHRKPAQDDPRATKEAQEAAQREWDRRIIVAAQQVSSRPGSIPAWAKPILEEIRRPTIPWQTVLAEHVTFHGKGSDSETWNRINPVLYAATGIPFPTYQGTNLEGVVAVDTSGSTQGFLKRFWSEMHGIVSANDNYRINVITNDCAGTISPKSTTTYSSDERPLPNKMTFPGGGGTDFKPVFQHLQKTGQEPNFLVYLTDGDGSAPEKPPGYPVLWVLTPGAKKPCNWGSAVWMTDSE